MKNLYKLKQYGYQGISVTDDFTIEERKKLKEMCEKAKKMNSENDGDFIWRVRGSPRTSLRFIKTPRKVTKTDTPSLSSISDVTDED